jgi:hypothetical protein
MLIIQATDIYFTRLFSTSIAMDKHSSLFCPNNKTMKSIPFSHSSAFLKDSIYNGSLAAKTHNKIERVNGT